MECNRDEAKRAKEIAERKFSTKDIMGARKFALKAQSLYPGLDGISQLLAILDVYVAAEDKVNGELDFYGILGVSPLADEDTVRKHYRKLALSLHPDKNKSIGADGAFKYVSEAWSLLSDKDKRSTYDRKRNGRVFKQKVQTQNGGSRVPTPPGQNGFNNFTKRTTTQTKGTTNTPRANTNATTKTGSTSVPSPSNKQTTPKTFWTVCKRCKLQYEYLRMYLNRKLLCPSCHEPFLAIETPPPNTNGSSEVPKNPKGASKNVSNPGRRKATGVEPGHFGDSSNYTSFLWGPFSKTTSPAAAAQAASMVQRAYERAKREREEAQAAIKREEALRRKISKKAGNFSSHGHLNSAKRKQDVSGFGANKETGPVGSSISSGQVEVTKAVSNVGKNRLMTKATKEIRNKLHEWSSETVENSTVGGVGVMEKADRSEKEKSKVDALVNGDLKNPQIEPLLHDVLPDFHDFDCDRSEKCFEEGQVWAAYDDHDGMPRCYAMIRKVISFDPFKMKICWLNSTPNNDPGLFSGFSKAFGEFRAGKHEILSVPSYFSHQVNFTKRANGTIHVFPRKGDVWALYSNDQTTNLVNQKYEIVEVDKYNEETGIMVTPLVKVAGFKMLFHRHISPDESRVVPENEIFRFSHQIPSYLLTDQESAGAPKGCRELDPAATPEFLLVIEIVNEAENIEDDDDDQMLDEDCVLATSE